MDKLNNSGMDLIDPALDDSDTTNRSKHTVPRYVNIGLLCVQESPADRPRYVKKLILPSQVGSPWTSKLFL